MGPDASAGVKFGNEAKGVPAEEARGDERARNVPTPVAGPPKPVPRWAGHPIFGHLRELRRDRIGMFLSLAKGDREIVEMPMGFTRRLVVVTSHTIANEVLIAQQADFVKSPGLAIFLRPVLGDGLLTSESSEHAERATLFNPAPRSRGAPAHERQRRLLAPAFAPKRIAAYANTMAERADRYTERLEGGATIDLAESIMRLTFEIVGKTLFDAEVTEDAATVGEALTVAMEVAMGQLGSMIPVPPGIPTPGNRRYRRAVTQLDDVIYRIIRERRAEGGDRGDVLSILLSSKDDDGSAMTDRQVRDEAMTLFLAGHETTANALAWTFYLLAKNPDVRARMEAELDALGRTPSSEDLKKLPYTLAVFKESMRLYPPAYVVSRSNVRDVTLGGYTLKEGAIIVVNIVGIQRRPDLWQDPDRFNPERFLADREKQLPRGAYMPFGAGPRVCIGNHFAMMEAHLLLATIARRVRFELHGPDVRLEPLVTLRPRDLFAKVDFRA